MNTTDIDTNPEESHENKETPATSQTPLNQRAVHGRKKLLILLFGIVALVVLIVTVALLLARSDDKPKVEVRQENNDSQNQNNVSGASFKQQYADSCTQRDASLTASPIPLAQLGYIDPLGKVSDGHVTPTDHMYFGPKNSHAADNTTDVVMPGDGTVVEISAMPSQYVGDKQQQTASEDHRIVIAHSCRYYTIFIHVHKLSDALAKAAGQLQPNQSKKVNLELKAGDQVGKIGGSPFDWTFLDTDKTLAGLITPSLYSREPWKIHTTNQFELYSGDMRSKLEALSLRSKAPVGGKIDYDIKGALIGNWFIEGTNGYAGADQSRYWDGHLSIAPDYIDGTTTIFSIGNWDGKANQFAVKGSFDASKITKSSGPVKVELLKRSYIFPNGTQWTGNETPTKGITVSQNSSSEGTVLVEVQDGEKLKVEKFIGKSPAQVSGFTDAAKTYAR